MLNKFNEFLRNINITKIIVFGIIFRIAFIFLGAKIYHGENIHWLGDTPGYVNSFLNLLKYGEYTFVLNSPEAYFGRVPVFPFFWGLNYLIVGEQFVYQSVTFSHLILELLSIYLIYKTSINLFKEKKHALISAFLYSIYPFIVVWITISYTEVLSSFLAILSAYIFSIENKEKKHYILLGIVLGLLVLTREFLGILLPIYVLIIFILKTPQRIKNILLLSFGFLVIYSSWPLRNYLNHDRVVFFRSYEGFLLYSKDYMKCRDYILCWTNNENQYLDSMLFSDNNVKCPDWIFSNPDDLDNLNKAINLGRECSSSFYYWKKTKFNDIEKPNSFCDEEVAKAFIYQKKKFIKNNFLTYCFYVPYLNVKKILFKSNLEKGGSKIKIILSNLLFSFRSLLVILGIISLTYSYKYKSTRFIHLFITFIYLFFIFYIRKIEMRNLLQAEILMLIPTGHYISTLITKIKSYVRG